MTMQMYRVKFARKISADLVDIGDVLVCAQSAESACDCVVNIMGLPRSETELHACRVKPSFYQISRREIKNSVGTFEALFVDAALSSVATFPGVTESRKDEFWYSVTAQADIRAEDENDAIAKLAKAVVREMSGDRQKQSCRDLDIRCGRKEYHPRTPAIEQNAIYKYRKIFQGGDTRT